jgi:hypothetical protein
MDPQKSLYFHFTPSLHLLHRNGEQSIDGPTDFGQGGGPPATGGGGGALGHACTPTAARNLGEDGLARPGHE